MTGTSRAAGIVADAVAQVIAARITQDVPGLPAEYAQRVARAAVADIATDGWHITALPVPAANPAAGTGPHTTTHPQHHGET